MLPGFLNALTQNRPKRHRRIRRSFPESELLECRQLLTAPVIGPLTVTGTNGNDTILVEGVPGSATDVTVTLNGSRSGSFRPTTAIVIHALDGNDQITVAESVVLATEIDAGPGTDVISGGSGGDWISTRDSAVDTVTGGEGIDIVVMDSLDILSGIERINPLQTNTENQSKNVKVLVLNYEPRIPTEGGQTLWQVFNWNDPRILAQEYENDLERASGGAINFDIVGWRDLNQFPAFTDGYRYSPDEYVQNRRTDSGWHNGTIDFPRIVDEQSVVSLIDSGAVDELWLFGDHFFVPMIGESWMSGPGAFRINGPVFSEIPTQRAFASMGFSYERETDEMLHNTGHRNEDTMNRIYGGWNLQTPATNWDKFSANYEQSDVNHRVAGVGTTHYPANAAVQYDTGNTRIVQSWADDFLNYPNLTGMTNPVNRDTWGRGTNPNYERDYQNWYFSHLPRAAGINPDGTQNNWSKYLYDFNNYTQNGTPKSLSAVSMAQDVYNFGSSTYMFSVAYSGAVPVNISTLDGNDVRVTGPNGFNQLAQLISVSDVTNDTHVVATYRIPSPGGSWDAADLGLYTIAIQPNQVLNVPGQTVASTSAGTFVLRTNAPAALPSDGNTKLLLNVNGNLSGASGESPVASSGATFASGLVGQAVSFDSNGFVQYENSGNIDATQGTVEFWIKPGWNGLNNGGHTFFHVGESFNNGMLLSFDGADNLRFVQWGDNPATPAPEVSFERGVATSGANWKAGDWHHVAATWNSNTGEMSLYVDGQMVDSISSGVGLTGFAGTSMTFGRENGGGSPAIAAFDDIRISDRSRSAGEIAADFRQAVSIVSVSIDMTDPTLSLGEARAVHAIATDSTGQSRDITSLVQWSTNSPSVLTVSSDGRIQANAAGTAAIRCQLAGLSASHTVSVRDLSGPLVTFDALDLQTSGGTAFLLPVRTTDNTAVAVASLGLGDLRVNGPNGFSAFLTLASLDFPSNGTPRNASYQFIPPGGYWDSSDNGIYTITFLPGQVSDTEGNINSRVGTDSFRVQIAPEILAPSWAIIDQRPTVFWRAAAGATGYEVWITNDSTQQNPVIQTTTVNSRFQPSTNLGIGKYRVWVRSIHIAGLRSAWSLASGFTITTAVTLSPLARQQNTSRPTVSWTPLLGAVKYDLWLNNLSTGQNEFVRSTNLTSTSWSHSSDLALGKYRVWVRGIDAQGNAATWSVATDFDVVPAPNLTSPQFATFSRQPTFTWTPVTGATKYEVFLRNLNNGVTTYDVKNVTSTSWTPPATLPDGPYRWWVQATSANNVTSLWSAPTDVYVGGRATVTGPVGSTGDATPTFTWQTVQGSVRYELWVSNAVTQARVIYQSALSGTSYTPTTELAKGSYRVWVRAVSVSGENAVWSAAVTFTVVNSSHVKSDADQPLLASLISERLIFTERSSVVELVSSASKQDRKEGPPALIGGEPCKNDLGSASATQPQIAFEASGVFTDAMRSGRVYHRIWVDDAKSKRSSQNTSALPCEFREIDRLMECYEIDV